MKTTKVMWVLTLLLALSQPITAQSDMRPVCPVSISQTDQWDRLQKSHEVSPALMRPRGYHEFTPLSSFDEKVIPQPFELPDKFIKHILQYTSMVCPEEFKGNYTDKLNMALDINILSDEVLKNVPNETIEIIKMMTNKNI